MNLTKEEIKKRNIRNYYILMDACNGDKFARCLTMIEIKHEARLYDEECDGEWQPELFLYNRDTKEYKYIEDWNY